MKKQSLQPLDTVTGNGLVAVIGRDEIIEHDGDFPKDSVFISITDPNKKPIVIKNKKKDILQLQFYDYPYEIPGKPIITKEQGKVIKDFILKHKNSLFVINCEAGYCRSSGIALAVEYLLSYLTDGYEKWSHFPSKVLAHPRYQNEINMDVFYKVVGDSLRDQEVIL